MSDLKKEDKPNEQAYGALLMNSLPSLQSQMMIPQLGNQLAPSSLPLSSSMQDLLKANLQNQQNMLNAANPKLGSNVPAPLSSMQDILKANQQLNHQQSMISAASQKYGSNMLTGNHQLSPNSQRNQQVLAGNQLQFMQGLAPNQPMQAAVPNQQLLSAAQNLNINLPPDIFSSQMQGANPSTLPMLQAMIQQAQLQERLMSNQYALPSLPMTQPNVPAINGTNVNGINGMSSAPANQFGLSNENSGLNYVDYAKHPDANKPGSGMKGARYKSFPVKLHEMLEDEEFSSYISWMPHGRAWKILRQDEFEEKVIPLFFRHAKFASFTRQVNGWGFRRVSEGLDRKCYYHEMFLRGMPRLCSEMKRPTESVRNSSDPRQQPNFYDTRSFTPLPSKSDTFNNSRSTNLSSSSIEALSRGDARESN
eukprot:CAMPEP_0194227310 /NCGR_PEP_ID=MMETSP0156-20130528/42792_1 /TAXON_ID=33649 /ORGANISM="Thalassionema nitzschioides, Strain L26-B" /LENGTH=421 /DNA_ID=CAMNT_0038959789 /DNA_START=80 /DNA_END=1345 /DNA_ORIENTATION=-